MLEWRDVIDLVVQALGTDAQSSVVLLEFLTVLPEEVMEGRKISLSVSTSELQHPTTTTPVCTCAELIRRTGG